MRANLRSKVDFGIRSQLSQHFGYDPAKTISRLKITTESLRSILERRIKVRKLFDEDFETELKNDLLANYQKTEKTGMMVIPENKKDLSCASLLLIGMKEMENVHGSRTPEVLNAIPSSILTKADKSYRNAQLKRLNCSLENRESSIYDLSELLVSTLI